MYRENVYVKELEGVGLGWVGGADTSLGGGFTFSSRGVVHCQVAFVFYYNYCFFFTLAAVKVRPTYTRRHSQGSQLCL